MGERALMVAFSQGNPMAPETGSRSLGRSGT